MTTFSYEDWKDERLSDFKADLNEWNQDQKYANRASDQALKLDMDRGDSVAVSVSGEELYSIEGQHAAIDNEENLVLTDEGPYIVFDGDAYNLGGHNDKRFGAGRTGNYQNTLFQVSGSEEWSENSIETADEYSAPATVSGVSTYMWSDEAGTVKIVDSAKNDVEVLLEKGQSLTL